MRNFVRSTVTVPWVQVFPQNMFGDVRSGVIRLCVNLNLVRTVVMLIAKGKKDPVRYN
jgi:hypothetical protein